MKCQHCKKETKGIKLNGKIFCTYCGEIVKDSVEILEEAYEHTPPKPSEKPEKEPRRISKEGETLKDAKKLELLEAEEEILEVIEKENKSKRKPVEQKIKNTEIKKKNRNRAGMVVVANEPDPIEEPEIESPHDDQIEAPGLDAEIRAPDKKLNYPLHNTETKKEMDESVKARQALLTAFLKEGANEISGSKKTKKKSGNKIKKAKSKNKSLDKKARSHKLFWILALLAIMALSMVVGLVYYVNNYAINESYVKKTVESVPTFNFVGPDYITPGYQLSYLSDSSENYIEYRYEKVTGNDYILLKAEKTNLEPDDIYEEIIKPTKQNYKSKKINNVETWEIGSNKIYFIKDDVLYAITSSASLLSEIRKIAEGVIN